MVQTVLSQCKTQPINQMHKFPSFSAGGVNQIQGWCHWLFVDPFVGRNQPWNSLQSQVTDTWNTVTIQR
jgi:hypothetical protein